MRVLLCLFICFCLVLLTGCGSSTAVSGVVTVDGKPVPKGVVNFDPLDGKGQTAGAPIENGNYTVKLKPGRYRVTAAGEGEGYAGKKQEEVMKMSEQELKKLTANPIPPLAIGNGAEVEIKGGSQKHDIVLTTGKK